LHACIHPNFIKSLAMKNKVFIAVDLSEQSATIINKGIEFAKKIDGTVVLSTIIPIYIDYLQSQMSLIPNQWDEIYNTQKSHAVNELKIIQAKHADIEIDLSVEVGNPKFDILEKANQLKATYIVVGTHGRTGLSHTVMGSTAEYIIRHATVPVLVVPMDRSEH
jgi:nucleotide-binding universal stress UspA family protein